MGDFVDKVQLEKAISNSEVKFWKAQMEQEEVLTKLRESIAALARRLDCMPVEEDPPTHRCPNCGVAIIPIDLTDDGSKAGA